jgi:hypothetical protein
MRTSRHKFSEAYFYSVVPLAIHMPIVPLCPHIAAQYGGSAPRIRNERADSSSNCADTQCAHRKLFKNFINFAVQAFHQNINLRIHEPKSR